MVFLFFILNPIQVQTAAEKAIEAYKRDHPEPCESANSSTKCEKWQIGQKLKFWTFFRKCTP